MMNQEELIKLCKESGFVASVGRSDKDGKYHPNVNALGKHVPIEWVEDIVKKAVEQQIRRDAEICLSTREYPTYDTEGRHWNWSASNCAKEILAQLEKQT